MANVRRWRIWLWLAVFSVLATAPCECMAALPMVKATSCTPRETGPAAAHHEKAADKMAADTAPMCERCPTAETARKSVATPCADDVAPAATKSASPGHKHPVSHNCACGCRWKDGPSTPQERASLLLPVPSVALLPRAVQSVPQPQFETVARIAERGLSPPQFSPPRSLPARAPPFA